MADHAWNHMESINEHESRATSDWPFPFTACTSSVAKPRLHTLTRVLELACTQSSVLVTNILVSNRKWQGRSKNTICGLSCQERQKKSGLIAWNETWGHNPHYVLLSRCFLQRESSNLCPLTASEIPASTMMNWDWRGGSVAKRTCRVKISEKNSHTREWFSESIK